MQERRNAGKEGYRKRGMQGKREAGEGEIRTVGIQERNNAGKEGYRKGGIQDWRYTGKE